MKSLRAALVVGLLVAATLPALALPLGLQLKRPHIFHGPQPIEKARVVEVARYQHCGQECVERADPTTTICLRQGSETLVAEARDKHLTDIDSLVGKELSFRSGRYSMSLLLPDGPSVKMSWTAHYEGYHDLGCVAAVHRWILDEAARQHRPSSVPTTAIAIPGPGLGEAHPLYLYYACSLNPAGSELLCQRWRPNGKPENNDWYCPRSSDGKPVAADFSIDPLTSQAGRLRLKSGLSLIHDNRSRYEGKLDRPNEECR